MMEQGLSKLVDAGIDVTVKEWRHDRLEELQKVNLEIEQGGSEVVEMPHMLFEDIDQYELIITQFAPIQEKVIVSARNLKLIGVLRGGMENINQAKAAEKGIAILNTPGRNARSVAEFTVGMILAEIRNIARSHAALKEGKWRKDFSNTAFIPELEGRTVGIVGFGHIGQLVAKLLSGFEARILFYDPYFKGETHFKQVELNELLQQSDIVSLHGRLTEETTNMIAYEQLKMMKESAILVNTARSGLIQEEDFLLAMQNKLIAGAAIDTFDHEPLRKDSPFLTLDNVTITAHLAGSTSDAFRNTPKKLAERVLKWMNTQA